MKLSEDTLAGTVASVVSTIPCCVLPERSLLFTNTLLVRLFAKSPSNFTPSIPSMIRFL